MKSLFISDINTLFARQVKVKSSIRKGKVVKGYTRKDNRPKKLAALGALAGVVPVAAVLNDAKQGEIRAVAEKAAKTKYRGGATDALSNKAYWKDMDDITNKARNTVSNKKVAFLGKSISADKRNLAVIGAAGLGAAAIGYGVGKLLPKKKDTPVPVKEKPEKYNNKDIAKKVGLGLVLGAGIIGGAALGGKIGKNIGMKSEIIKLKNRRNQLKPGYKPTDQYTKLQNESDNLSLQMDKLTEGLPEALRKKLTVNVRKAEYLSKPSKQERRAAIASSTRLGMRIGTGISAVGAGTIGYRSMRKKKKD